MIKIIKMTLFTILMALVAMIAFVVLFFYTAPQIGERATGIRLEEVKASPQFKGDKFYNSVETNTEFPVSKYLKVLYQMLTNTESREPQQVIETVVFDAQTWEARTNDEIMLSWFGHSSVLIKIDGKTILADPVFGERASMFSFMGPKKFDYTHHMQVDLLPKVDLVIISHDHYDHLDYPTILLLKDRVSQFFVPVGVASHLESWGVPAENIRTFDWWDGAALDENIRLTFTPTRHFSGRAINDKFSTLWGSWVVEGKSQKLYFSGDSGYFPGFKEIGEKFGGFDFALIECGAYNQENWPDIHMMPEQSVQAALDVKAKIAMPIHWGKFDLGLHAWKDPIQRFMKEAGAKSLPAHTPVAGEILLIPTEAKNSEWWEKYE